MPPTNVDGKNSRRVKKKDYNMQKSESVRGNETHKILCDFEKETNRPIPTQGPDLGEKKREHAI